MTEQHLENKYLIFEVGGGFGRNIFASAVLSALKRKYKDRKIIILASWPEAFINNPNAYRVYRVGVTPYFYEDFIENKDTIIISSEPYKTDDFIKERSNIVKSWCDLLNVEYNNELPELFITPAEEYQLLSRVKTDKPIMVIQPFGGGNKNIPYSWNRDIPIHQAQSLVNIFAKDFNVYQMSTKEQPTLQNAIKMEMNARDCLALLKYSNARVLIDSFGQHACAALGKKAVVCWITNKPEVFGYKFNTNIVADTSKCKFVHNIDSGLVKYSFGGERSYDYPFPTMDVFDLNSIVDGVRKIYYEEYARK